MSGALPAYGKKAERGAAELETPLVRALLIGVTFVFLALFLVAPLLTVFSAALSKGLGAYAQALSEPETLSAIWLTLLTAAIAVPMNTVFGIAAAWLLSKYEFRGKSALLTLIDLPFSVSPVIAGLVFVLLFGAQGWFAGLARDYDVRIIFAVPGIVLATTFVTFPLVAREVLAVMEAQGSDEEEAALTLGASWPQIFIKVTLPKIRWGLFYGVILCNARAMGEFGAVSVVSGHIRGETNTMPLQVEILYNEYNFVAAFAVASLLTLLALVTLAVKKVAEYTLHVRDSRRARQAESSPELTMMKPGSVVLP
jgi:sulfate/thiosulfate transport system permease protein